MTGRPGHRTMEMIGGSSAPYLARTPCVPLFCTSFNRVGNKERFRLPGAGGGSFPLYGGTFARSYSVSKNGKLPAFLPMQCACCMQPVLLASQKLPELLVSQDDVHRCGDSIGAAGRNLQENRSPLCATALALDSSGYSGEICQQCRLARAVLLSAERALLALVEQPFSEDARSLNW